MYFERVNLRPQVSTSVGWGLYLKQQTILFSNHFVDNPTSTGYGLSILLWSFFGEYKVQIGATWYT